MTRMQIAGVNGTSTTTGDKSDTRKLQQFAIMGTEDQIRYLTKLLNKASEAMGQGVSPGAETLYERCKRYQTPIAAQHAQKYNALFHRTLAAQQTLFQSAFKRCKGVRHQYEITKKANAGALTQLAQPPPVQPHPPSNKDLSDNVTERTLMQPDELEYFTNEIAPQMEGTGYLDIYVVRLVGQKKTLFKGFNHPDEARDFVTDHQPLTPQDQYIFRKKVTLEGQDYTLVTLEQLAELDQSPKPISPAQQDNS